jgi:hypothetical protein
MLRPLLDIRIQLDEEAIYQPLAFMPPAAATGIAFHGGALGTNRALLGCHPSDLGTLPLWDRTLSRLAIETT